MESIQYLIQYEKTLTEVLIGQCNSKGMMDKYLIDIDELNEEWEQIAPEYMADTVPQVNDYPAVTMAWAAYVGMAVAAMWDGAWSEFKDKKDLYSALRDARGFDEMDEHIMEDILGIDATSAETKQFAELLRGCAHTAMTIIRNEKFEPQSADAFYVFARTAKVFFKLGVSLELKQLGYKYDKVLAGDNFEILS